MQHVLMQRSPRVLHSMVASSMVCPLLALRDWKQLKLVLQHEDSNEDSLGFFFLEGMLESLPQLAIGQVRAYQ